MGAWLAFTWTLIRYAGFVLMNAVCIEPKNATPCFVLISVCLHVS